jgi:hypothetical protein
MAASRRPKTSNLRDAINAFRVEHDGKGTLLDEDLKLLERLVESDDAAKAFERLKPWHADMPGYTNVHGGNILNWCIMARLSVDKRHGFRAIIVGAQKTSARMNMVDKAIALVRKLIDDEAIGALRTFADEENIAGLRKFLDLENIKELKTNLDLIDDRIDKRRRSAEEIESRLGASRKKHINEAPENLAIWVLASNIKRKTGKPHQRQVADLAAVILNKEVSIERVHSVARSHKPPLRKRIRRARLPKGRD